MNLYKAEFQFRLESLNQTRGFKLEEEVPVASIPEPDPELYADVARKLERVVLYDTQDNVIASILGKELLRSVVAPKITISLPSTAPIDGTIIISALVENLPSEYWDRTVCRWSIDPAIGAFKQSETSIEMVSSKRGRSVAMLDVLNKKDNAGLRPYVKVELFLKD